MRIEFSTHNDIAPGQQESDLPAELANPARRALVQAGYWRLEQVAQLSEAQVRQLHGIGPRAINQLRYALSQKGLSFAGEDARASL